MPPGRQVIPSILIIFADRRYRRGWIRRANPDRSPNVRSIGLQQDGLSRSNCKKEFEVFHAA
jgi:hypothetical protein